jgi:hypothetical protein
MKVGDKLYCIKDSYDSRGQLAHISNKFYIIQGITDYPRMPSSPGVGRITSILLEAEYGFYGYNLKGGIMYMIILLILKN